MSVSQSLYAEQACSSRIFYPLNSVRCNGPAVFRSQVARDVACLLDVDDEVDGWSCQSLTLSSGGHVHKPDFVLQRAGLTVAMDCIQQQPVPPWLSLAADEAGLIYETIDVSTIPKVRLKNAKDLLRYARHDATLSDRIRVLAVLDEYSSLTVAEILPIFQDAKPIAGLASMVLQRFLSINLDGLIGPETVVRRKRG